MKSLRDYINLLNEGGATNPAAQAQAAAPAPGTAAATRAGQGASPAVNPRYKTPQEYDAEIARFSKSSNPALAPNKRYIDTLNAEKAALQKQQGATPAKPAAPALTAQPDPNVKALQDKLIAAGAKIKADGIMGPATRAAQQQFPNVTTQSSAEQAVAADINKGEQGGQGATPVDPAKVDGNANMPPEMAAQMAAQTAPKPAGWTPTPEQAKWLGGANQQDPYIMSRMPGAKPPVSFFTDPNDQKIAQQMGFPAAAGAAPASVAQAVAANPAPAAAPAPAAGQGATPAAAPTPGATIDQATGKVASATDATRWGMGESQGYDEVERLVSLIHYK